MTIQTEALQRALTLLKLGQVEYHLRLPDGKELLSEGFVPPKSKRSRRHNYFIPHYRSQLAEVKVGEVVVLQPPADIELVGLQKTVSSWCARHWGKDSYLTEAGHERHELTVARVS